MLCIILYAHYVFYNYNLGGITKIRPSFKENTKYQMPRAEPAVDRSRSSPSQTAGKKNKSNAGLEAQVEGAKLVVIDGRNSETGNAAF
jgi:hypothetical protein